MHPFAPQLREAGRAHQADKPAQRVAHQVHRPRVVSHQRLGKVGQLLHQVRPVAGDGVARVVPEAVQRHHGQTMGAQAFEHLAVGGPGEAVAVAEDDQRLGGVGGGQGQISFSDSLLIFLSGRLRPLPVSKGTSVWLPSQVGSSMLSNTSRNFWPQVLCTILK